MYAPTATPTASGTARRKVESGGISIRGSRATRTAQMATPAATTARRMFR